MLILRVKTFTVCIFAQLLLLTLCLSGVAQAAPENTPKNRIPGPMIAPQALPGSGSLPAGMVAVVDHMTVSHAKFYKDSSPYSAKNPRGASVGPKTAEQFVNVLKFRFGLPGPFDFRTATPYISSDVRRHSPQGGTWKGGFGDTAVMLRTELIRRTDESPFSLSLDLGGILPTGQAGDKNKYLAPNAFAGSAGVVGTWADYNQRIDLDVIYTAYARGAHGITPSNWFMSHAHYAYAVSDYFDVGAESVLRLEGQSEVRGKNQHDAMSEWYAGPKVQVKIPEWNNLMIGTAVMFPLYREYDSARFSTDTRYEFRVGVAF